MINSRREQFQCGLWSRNLPSKKQSSIFQSVRLNQFFSLHMEPFAENAFVEQGKKQAAVVYA